MKVVLLSGGESPEREVSLLSGKAVAAALKKKGHEVCTLDPSKKNFFKKILESRPDCAFIALHGGMGEGGIIQGFLEVLKIPYTGSGVRSSAVCQNKIMTKKILLHNNLPTPAFIEASTEKTQAIPFGLPAVVKPANLGSTIGIKIVRDKSELDNAVKKAFVLDNEVLIEEYMQGTEITVGILESAKGTETLPTIEIETPTGFYDYKAKYTKGGSRHIIPPRLSEEKIKKAEDIALKAYKILGCSGFARIEMIMKRNTPYILDVNTIPGLTKFSLFPDAAKAKGISFENLCEKIINLAKKNANKNKRKNKRD